MIDHCDMMSRYADIRARQSLDELGHPTVRIHYLGVFDLPERNESRPLGISTDVAGALLCRLGTGIARAMPSRLRAPLDA